MHSSLIDIITGDLLAKFGAGSHKPGAGSACAFNGMIAAQLLRTVIELTIDPKHNKFYSASIPQLLKVKNDIELRIYKKLEALFDKDSVQFDEGINLRKQRYKENDPYLKSELSSKTVDALQTATEIPLDIAELCLDLGMYAAYVFDNGFQSARGDSSVSLNYANATVISCLSIVELNLISLPTNNRTVKIRYRKTEIKKQYQELVILGTKKLYILEKEADDTKLFLENVKMFRAGNLSESLGRMRILKWQ